MGKKLVRVPYLAWCNVVVETDSDDEDEIIDLALQYAGFSHFCGNGSTGGRLVGTSEENVDVEVCDEPFDGDGITIEVEDVDDRDPERRKRFRSPSNAAFSMPAQSATILGTVYRRLVAG